MAYLPIIDNITTTNNPAAEELAETFVSIREIEDSEFPLYPPLIAKYQEKDKTLKRLMKDKSNDISVNKVENVDLIHLNNKIYIPRTLQS